ncbi:N-acyl-D-glucosamine 2-epimerase [Paenibacillus sp. RC67]|uniref:N-acyl-D-glucosamine 2-epimerase n=1 Tax=Paenibacillus sp. RC67 TaxID=3039392 RepID=UPI0024AE0895|nr:N-acyl-D-glucosamine 2-epimerase [Paenibacillus sp. RC67]
MKNMLGPSIQVDPAFPYYLNRSPQSIADELWIAGYRVVRYFVTDETKVNEQLLKELHRQGFAVWATVLGNGTYTTAHLPDDWPDWQMTLLKPVNDGYYRLSPFSYRYVAWKKQALAELVKAYPFDGLEIAEPYFPEWNGLSSGVYGDIGPYARAAFKQQYGSDIPEFKYTSSPMYYKNNPILYRQWVEFRVSAVNRFLFELINGREGVREVRPDIRIATWSLGVDAGPDSVQKLREYQGIDAAAMVSYVRPDVHFIQTHWPDWMRWRLPANYIARYEPFAARIRALHPALPLGIQADIGSLKNMRRDREWLKEFANTANQLGYATWTAYEYHLGKYMYDEAPRAVRAERIANDKVRIHFQKRIDSESVLSSHFTVLIDGKPEHDIQISAKEVDGNRILLYSTNFPSMRFQISITNVKDTPGLWLFPSNKANQTSTPCLVTVEASMNQ